jgi:hypothetical protein
MTMSAHPGTMRMTLRRQACALRLPFGGWAPQGVPRGAALSARMARISEVEVTVHVSSSAWANELDRVSVSRRATLIFPGFSRWACERRCVGSSDKAFETSVGKRGSVSPGS